MLINVPRGDAVNPASKVERGQRNVPQDREWKQSVVSRLLLRLLGLGGAILLRGVVPLSCHESLVSKTAGTTSEYR
jgi:hypothetical protein